ncbi:hypothetical protein [Vibrio phage VpV262]|uniref:Uncharacterized protein n=1 Tax=Vibrio phage VpV262 TaxID=2907796 RepID=Q8LT48_9CAUD|nr:hypothetical protein VpV262p56 [Vibrio phage VpV262]AAM28403.1 hypothetical protein [Vibrio phage VpV262]
MSRESITAGSTAGGTRRAATHYGRRVEEGANISVYHVDGNVFRQETTFKFDQLPTATLDQLHQAIPAGSRVLSATLKTHVDFTATTAVSLNIGLQERDGTEVDNDGLFAALALPSANDFDDGAGALVGAGTGLTVDAVVVVVPNVDDLLTGEATLVVEYEKADDRQQAMNG